MNFYEIQSIDSFHNLTKNKHPVLLFLTFFILFFDLALVKPSRLQA